MAEITDLLGKASIDSDYAIATTVKTTRAPGATVLEAYDVSKFADDTPVFFITYKKVTDPETGDVSVTELVSYKALVNTGANTLTNLEVAPGYVDIGNDEDDFIECIPTSYWENSLINALLTSLTPIGKLRKNAPIDGDTTFDSGWLGASGTWAYSSWSSTTRIGVLTVPSNATEIINVKDRIRITQATGGTKYGIVVKVEATALTVFFPVGTTLENEAITSPQYSHMSSPMGFNSDPALWSLTAVSTTNRSTSGTSFVTFTDAITLGIGAWFFGYQAELNISISTSPASTRVGSLILSTNGTENDTNLTTTIGLQTGASAEQSTRNKQRVQTDLLLTAQTTFTFYGKTNVGSPAPTLSKVNSTIFARCAYL